MRTTLTLAAGVVLTACSACDDRAVDTPADVGGRSGAALDDAVSNPLKLAFLGDQGVGNDARSVLELVARERADALVILGDFAYSDGTPSSWNAQLDAVLGADFPVFAVIGNHDVSAWAGDDGFQAYLLARLQRISDARCTGEYGVNASCTFRGVTLVLSGVGTYGTDHELFIESALRTSDTPFRFCLWHKNQHDMQVGAKSDEVGWDAYRLCAMHAAPVITGHEHSYARSFILDAIGDHDQGHGAVGPPGYLDLAPGRTFVAVAGLGGKSRRVRTPDHEADTWWASVYAGNYQLHNAVLESTAETIQYGALFLEIGVQGDPRQAHGYFMTVDGELHDDFELRAP